MKSQRRLAAAGLAACFAVTSGGLGHSAENAAAAPALARIEAAATAHPDDPDLAWALARQLAREGRGQDAVDSTHRFLARWPDRRAEARVEIARSLLESGAAVAAQALLDEEVRHAPASAVAHFYRGMAMRANHADDDANREFQAAALLEPALRSETLLVRALIAFDGGRDKEAVSLLRELLRSDPTSDSSVRARLILRDREILRADQRLRAEASAGFEWDDNVTLEGTESEISASNRDDFRGNWGVGLSGQPWLGERGGLLLGYRYDQSHHHELDEFDMLQNSIFGSLSLQPSEARKQRFALRLDATGYDTLQDFDRALSGASFRPNVLFAIGPRAGVLRGFGVFEVAEFNGDAGFEAWERDSLSGGLGLEQIVPLPPRGSTISISASWLRSVTQARPDGSPDGFDGDFDYDAFRFRALGRFALPWSLRLQIEGSYSRDDYLNDNLAHALETLAQGNLKFEARADHILAGRIAFSRPIAPFTRLEIYWRGTRRASNVTLFDYDKQLVGLVVHVASE